MSDRNVHLQRFIFLFIVALLVAVFLGLTFLRWVSNVKISPNTADFSTLSVEEAYADEQLFASSTTLPTITPISSALLPATNTPVSGDSNFPDDSQQDLLPSATPYPVIYNEENIPMMVTWGNYPAPEYWHGTQIPAPMGLLPRSAEQVVVLLMGNDKMNHSKGARTDVNMLLILNTETLSATIISFPRDLYVYAPGHTMMRLNSVQGLGGFELSALTYEYNFGIRPDYYVNINADNFISVIDRLGGVDVFVPKPVSDPVFAGGKFSVPAGMVHMDGRTARWYVRSRYGTSDLERNQRQQEVLKAIFERLMSFYGVENVSFIYNVYSQSVLTNLEIDTLTPLIPLALTFKENPDLVRRYAINEDELIPYTSPAGGSVFLLDQNAAIIKLVQVLSPWEIGE